MAVKTQPKKYISNGREFDTKAEAERHDALVAAKNALEEAQRTYQRLLAEGAVTADGQPFEFGVFPTYYYIATPGMSKPYMRQFSYLCWSWSVRDSDEPGKVEIADKSDDDGRTRYVPIPELYRSKEKAEAALIKAQKKWLEEERGYIEKDAERLSRSR